MAHLVADHQLRHALGSALEGVDVDEELGPTPVGVAPGVGGDGCRPRPSGPPRLRCCPRATGRRGRLTVTDLPGPCSRLLPASLESSARSTQGPNLLASSDLVPRPQPDLDRRVVPVEQHSVAGGKAPQEIGRCKTTVSGVLPHAAPVGGEKTSTSQVGRLGLEPSTLGLKVQIRGSRPCRSVPVCAGQRPLLVLAVFSRLTPYRPVRETFRGTRSPLRVPAAKEG